MHPQHISTHITANFHLGLNYHHDRVEEGRDGLHFHLPEKLSLFQSQARDAGLENARQLLLFDAAPSNAN